MPDPIPNLSIWPHVLHVEQGSAVIWFSPDLQHDIICTISPQPPWVTKIPAACDRFKSTVFANGGFIPEKLYPLRSDLTPTSSSDSAYVGRVSITIVETGLTSSGNSDLTLSEGGYELRIQDAGKASIVCSSYSGFLYALHTLNQVLYGVPKASGSSTNTSASLYMNHAPLMIRDRPHFAHRGINLDIARNRITAEDVKRTIRAMSFSKLNKLHLHATDSQSWPLEVPSLPLLAERGAYSPSQIWTVATLEEVQAFGDDHAVEVYLEIDMPHHTGSIVHSYPDCIVGYNLQPWDEYAAEPPAGQLRLNSPHTVKLINKLLSDVLPRAAHHSQSFHLGGDELNCKVYEHEEAIKSSDKEVLRPYVQSFFDRAFAHLKDHGLAPIMWEDMILDFDIQVPSNTDVQVWRSHESLVKLVSKGHRVLFGPCSHYYLDQGFGSWVDPKRDSSKVNPPFESWAGAYKNWRQICSYGPYEGVSHDKRHLIIGGETHLWGELTDSVTIDRMLWPRAAAAGQTLWSGVQTITEATTRGLAEFRERLVLQGIGAEMVQMEWCLRNPGSSEQ